MSKMGKLYEDLYRHHHVWTSQYGHSTQNWHFTVPNQRQNGKKSKLEYFYHVWLEDGEGC